MSVIRSCIQWDRIIAPSAGLMTRLTLVLVSSQEVISEITFVNTLVSLELLTCDTAGAVVNLALTCLAIT